MSQDESPVVTGSVYGSALGLLAALCVPLLCLSVPLAAVGVWSWAAPIAVAVAGLVVAPWIRRNNTLGVSSEGVTMLRFGRVGFVAWSDVATIEDGWFPALLLTAPQKVGRRLVRRVRFAGVDPRWRLRPTSIAVAQGFAASRGPAG